MPSQLPRGASVLKKASEEDLFRSEIRSNRAAERHDGRHMFRRVRAESEQGENLWAEPCAAGENPRRPSVWVQQSWPPLEGRYDSVFGQFTQAVSDASGWAYGIVFLVAFLDALIPIVPSETAVITGGVVAADGHLSLPLLIAVAAGGAFVGDNTAYLIGRLFGVRAKERFSDDGRFRKALNFAERQLEERGGELIVVGRFIPGGRTAVTLSAGTLRYPWRRFVVFDAMASLGWALYASLLGYFGGHAFEQAPWKGLLLALGIAFAVTGTIEVVRWYRNRRPVRSADS
jgi:membrane-associated protein